MFSVNRYVHTRYLYLVCMHTAVRAVVTEIVYDKPAIC